MLRKFRPVVDFMCREIARIRKNFHFAFAKIKGNFAKIRKHPACFSNLNRHSWAQLPLIR